MGGTICQGEEKFMTSIVVPKAAVRCYRMMQQMDVLKQGGGTGPNSVSFIENITVKQANDRLIHLNHETTALIGDFVDLSLSEENSGAEILSSLSTNDHTEVFYEGSTEASIGKLPLLGDKIQFIQKFVSAFTGTKPQFFGLLWKPEHTQNSKTGIITKIKAWNYTRLLQYYHIPRGRGGSYRVGMRNIVRDPDNGQALSVFETSSETVNWSNDFLDYVDHAVELYLTEMHGQNKATTMSVPFFESANPSGSQVHFDNLRVLPVTIDSGGIDKTRFVGPGSDYPNIDEETLETFHLTAEVPDMEEFIKERVSGVETVMVNRFIDANVKLITGFSGVTSVRAKGDVVRVVGEIIVVDQFALTRILTGAVTHDYGLNSWFTPIIEWDDDYRQKISNAILAMEQAGGTIDTQGRLVYIRFRVANISFADNTTPSSTALERIAVFNRDTWGNILEFFGAATAINQQVIFDLVQNNYDFRTLDRKRMPGFLSLLLSSVPFPQIPAKGLRSHYSTVATLGSSRRLTAEVYTAIAEGVEINGSDQQLWFFNLKQQYLRNASGYARLMNKALEVDDHFVMYITSMPATYMRADAHTGSNFNTFDGDSLTFLRIIQFLSTSMSGLPLTNNPTHGTLTTSVLNNYPILMSNRVIIEPELFVAKKSNSRVYTGNNSVSFWADKGDLNDLYLFLRLKVSLKLQAPDQKSTEFKIDTGDLHDLYISKASNRNHLFNFYFDKSAKLLADINEVIRGGSVLTENDMWFTLEYNMGNIRREDVVTYTRNRRGQWESKKVREASTFTHSPGISPPDYNNMTHHDLTRDSEYSPLGDRVAINATVHIQTEKHRALPVADPILAWQIIHEVSITDDPQVFYDGFIRWDHSTEKNSKITFEAASQDPPKGLLSVSSYTNVRDLQKELQYYTSLAKSPDVGYADLQGTGRMQMLFDAIGIRIPIKVEFNREEYKWVLSHLETDRVFSVSEVIVELNNIFKDFTETDMIKLFPLSGHMYLNNDMVDNPIVPIAYSSHPTLFKPFGSGYFVVAFLDLLLKGLRHMIWTIGKSGYLAVAEGAADHRKLEDMIGKNTLPQLWQKQSPVERMDADIRIGSSVLFWQGEQSSLRGITGKVLNIPEYIRAGKDFLWTQLTSGDRANAFQVIKQPNNQSDALIWYVVRKVLNISASGGYTMKLWLTEGSFDWTLYHREDTILTRMAENFMLNGMGNFSISRGGQ
jgi:hypothetical protein